MNNERSGIITFKGNPFTLLGSEIKCGDKAPDFKVVDNSLAAVTLATYSGKIKVISAVPSLDTPVCDTETRRFNQEAAGLPENVVVLTISLDLPFAQKDGAAQPESTGLRHFPIIRSALLLLPTVSSSKN